MENGYLVLESGLCYRGRFRGGENRAGEIVFNTSHSGYEEMATDPSYYSQILVCTAPQQGNYGVSKDFWESKKMWISGFICLDIQSSPRDSSWLNQLTSSGIPVLTDIDTRKIVLHLREQGVVWGAIVMADGEVDARRLATELIKRAKDLPEDWTKIVSRKTVEDVKGHISRGPRVALYDFGTKENILRELQRLSSEIRIFPSGTNAETIKDWNPDCIVLSNGPGDPALVKDGVRAVRDLLGWCPMLGICMGHQVLALALGARTYKLKFGHRGSNHPIQDRILNRVYVASQNHGYNVDEKSIPHGVQITHINLNDNSVAGIACAEHKCWSVQFHPESHPGPHDACELFDFFIGKVLCATTT